MAGDYSRIPDGLLRHFSSVLMQQGRVHLDSDWNEMARLAAHRWTTQADDTFGPAAVPRLTTPNGFAVTAAATTPADLLIGAGRCYVDGLQAELFPHETFGGKAISYLKPALPAWPAAADHRQRPGFSGCVGARGHRGRRGAGLARPCPGRGGHHHPAADGLAGQIAHRRSDLEQPGVVQHRFERGVPGLGRDHQHPGQRAGGADRSLHPARPGRLSRHREPAVSRADPHRRQCHGRALEMVGGRTPRWSAGC